MKDQEKRKKIDMNDPIVTYDELINKKMKTKNLTREEAIADTLKTSTKTRKSVNEMLGLR